MSFEEQAKKVIAELTEDDINALKDTQNIKNHINRLEEIVGRIFDFDYSDNKNYDKIKEIFPDIEDISQDIEEISQDGQVWSKNGLDVEIPQITDDGHTVKLWIGLYAEEELWDDDKGVTSPITLQFSLETVYDNTSEPWHIVTRCVPVPSEIKAMQAIKAPQSIEAMQSFTKENVSVEKDNKTQNKGENR